jgi:hypothetical protein
MKPYKVRLILSEPRDSKFARTVEISSKFRNIKILIRRNESNNQMDTTITCEKLKSKYLFLLQVE